MLRSALLTLSLVLAQLVNAQTASPSAASGSPQPLIILIGPPLSGKTIFADSISRTYGVPSISIEDLIDTVRERAKITGRESDRVHIEDADGKEHTQEVSAGVHSARSVVRL